MKRTLTFLLATGLCAALPSAAQSLPPTYQVHGGGWMESGRVMNSSDADFDLNGSWLQTVGAQFTVNAQLGEGWDGAFGFGAYQVNHSLAATPDLANAPKFLAITMFKSYITEARVTYSQASATDAWRFAATVGNFVHKYNPDAKNLGMYLLRGPVYPGVLFSGFDEFGTDSTRANVLGGRLHVEHGAFAHDLILMNEKDLPPTFDWSVVYIGKFRVPGIEVGAGANFYRQIPYDSDMLTPGKLPGADPSTYEVDGSGDTLYYTHKGVKLMGMFSIDPKQWIAAPALGREDLKLYGEAAILGIKDYGSYYDDITERIPVMVGFNLPAFGYLDVLSLEVEWYGSPYRNSLSNLGNPNGIVADWTIQTRPIPSPAPVMYAGSGAGRDDWKWSLRLDKTVRQHIQFSAQVANDHFRPRPIATGLISAGGGNATAFTTPEDWYWTFRVGYFF